MSEKIVLTNEQALEIQNIELQGDKIDIYLCSTPITELEELFSTKNIISTIKVFTEGNEQVASYNGYTNFISLRKDIATSLTVVTLGKVDETQERINDLEKQLQALMEIVSKLS